jgi:uncharacterized protein (DUF1684 family)
MSKLRDFRKNKDHFFKSDPHSPLPADERRTFTGLHYYAENQSLHFDVTVERFPEQERILMHTSTGAIQEYYRYGTFSFEVDGRPATLTVFSSGEQGDAFVPFADATSGRETYGAGRYLALRWLGADRYRVDFNLAYNPWCAYSPRYSCPIPPAQNRLKVPIRAGEKDYHGH